MATKLATQASPPADTARPRYWRLAFFLVIALVLLSSSYLSGNPDNYLEEQRDVYVENEGLLLSHIVSAMLAVVIGCLQMLPSIRVNRPAVHRYLGRVYAVSVAVSAVVGFLLAKIAFGGTVTMVGFRVLAVLWFATLVPAVIRIRQGDVAAHRRWMIRNYALTFAAVMLRVWLSVAIPLGVEFIDIYRVVAWLSWIPNLIAAELYVRRRPGLQSLATGAG